MTPRERAEKLVHSIIENGADKFAVDDAERMIRQAIEEERESCEKAVEALPDRWIKHAAWPGTVGDAIRGVVRAVRARKATP